MLPENRIVGKIAFSLNSGQKVLVHLIETNTLLECSVICIKKGQLS